MQVIINFKYEVQFTKSPVAYELEPSSAPHTVSPVKWFFNRKEEGSLNIRCQELTEQYQLIWGLVQSRDTNTSTNLRSIEGQNMYIMDDNHHHSSIGGFGNSGLRFPQPQMLPIFDTIRNAPHHHEHGKLLFQTERATHQHQFQPYYQIPPMFQVQKSYRNHQPFEEGVLGQNAEHLFDRGIPDQEQLSQDFPQLSSSSQVVTSQGGKLNRKKSYEKRGLLTQYLTSLSEEQLVANTLSGFLINFLRKHPEGLEFQQIMEGCKSAFPTLRKPCGSLYESQSIERTIKSALTANMLFAQVERKGAVAKWKKKKIPSTMVWVVKEPEASEFINSEIVKFAENKGKLSLRGRKPALNKEQFNNLINPIEQLKDETPVQKAPQQERFIDFENIVENSHKQIAVEAYNLEQLNEQRRSHTSELDDYKFKFDFLTKVSKEISKVEPIKMQTALSTFEDMVAFHGTLEKKHIEESQKFREQERQDFSTFQHEEQGLISDKEVQLRQLEGFMDVYNAFRPLLADYFDDSSDDSSDDLEESVTLLYDKLSSMLKKVELKLIKHNQTQPLSKSQQSLKPNLGKRKKPTQKLVQRKNGL